MPAGANAAVPAEAKCAERVQLADALTRAVADACARSREYQAARDRKENTFEFSLALQNARVVERAAVYAYDHHLKKHGCKF
jgi:hypothetical protein